jgi:hypothetical protein
MIRIFSLCIVLVFGVLNTRAQWNRIKIEGGGSKALARTNNYVFTYNATNLYRAPINTINWELLAQKELIDNLDFVGNALQLVNYHNELFLFNLNAKPSIVKTHDEGINWSKIQLNPNHKIKSSFVYKDSFYITANSINSNGKDSTIIYKYQTNTFLVQYKYAINYSVNSYNDTLVFINNQNDQWLISENFTNFQPYGVDLFKDKLTLLKKYGTRFYGVLNAKYLYYSDALGLWKNLLEVPNEHVIRNYTLLDSILFIGTNFQNNSYLFKYDFNTRHLVQLTNSIGIFDNIFKLQNKYLIGTNKGVFQFDLSGNFTAKVTGILSNNSEVFEYKNRLYLYDDGKINYSDDLGQHWQSLSQTINLNSMRNRLELKHRTFIIQDFTLYELKNKELELEEIVLPDSTLSFPSFLGNDEQYVYLNFNNSKQNGFSYFKIDANLSISPIKGLNPPLYLPLTSFFVEKDTLFGFGMNPEYQYYSLNSGDYWNAYQRNPIVDKDYYAYRVDNIAGVLFTQFMDFSKIGRSDIIAYRENSKWTKSSGYYNAYNSNGFYYKGKCVFIYDGLGNLMYSCDTFKTFTNTGIDFSPFTNKSIHRINIINNTLFVSFYNYGIWTHPLNINTGIPNKVIESLCIYPNPSNSFITIKNYEKIDELNVFSLDGNLVMHFSDVKDNTINIENLAQGMYLLSCKQGVARFVKN